MGQQSSQIKTLSGTNMCVGVPNNSKKMVYPLEAQKCDNSLSQEWLYDSLTGSVKNSSSGLCMDIQGGVTANGTEVGQHQCNAGQPPQL